MDQSFATGNVEATSLYDGGLIGTFTKSYYAQISVSNSYATGSVNGVNYATVGGFVGELIRPYKTITSSYSIGPVKGGNPETIGGFAGRYHDAVSENDYWDVDTSGQQQACQKKCDGVVGLMDAQFKSGLPQGFDPNIWGSDPTINSGYPYLRANPPPK